jgi:hypothetical protein
MEGPMEQFFEVFNEVMVFITTATVLCFTDAYGNLTQKRDAGNFACGVIYLMILVNFIGMFLNIYSGLRLIYLKIKSKFSKKKTVKTLA